jgi:hypothetical protein
LIRTFDKNGRFIAESGKENFPQYHEAETTEGLKWYKTQITNAGKIVMSSATEQEIKLINYLKEEQNV